MKRAPVWTVTKLPVRLGKPKRNLSAAKFSKFHPLIVLDESPGERFIAARATLFWPTLTRLANGQLREDPKTWLPSRGARMRGAYAMKGDL
jgi:hypothetical protein